MKMSKSFEVAGERLKGLGYASVFVDYIGRRTSTGNCMTAGIPKSEASADLNEVASWLKNQAFADKGNLVVIGWSYGGGGLMDAFSRYSAEGLGISKATIRRRASSSSGRDASRRRRRRPSSARSLPS